MLQFTTLLYFTTCTSCHLRCDVLNFMLVCRLMTKNIIPLDTLPLAGCTKAQFGRSCHSTKHGMMAAHSAQFDGRAQEEGVSLRRTHPAVHTSFSSSPSADSRYGLYVSCCLKPSAASTSSRLSYHLLKNTRSHDQTCRGL
jgi:hypothetical protein